MCFFCHSCVSRGSAIWAVLNSLQDMVGIPLSLALIKWRLHHYWSVELHGVINVKDLRSSCYSSEVFYKTVLQYVIY